MSPQLQKGAIISGLQEALPVETLFQPEIISGLIILYKVIRDYLMLQGHTYNPYPGKHYKSYGVTNSFFTHPEDRDYAIESLIILRRTVTADHSGASHSGISSTSTAQSGYQNRMEDTERKLAHYVAQPFKVVEDLLKCTPVKDIEEFLKTYETTTVDYKLDNLLNLQ